MRRAKHLAVKDEFAPADVANRPRCSACRDEPELRRAQRLVEPVRVQGLIAQQVRTIASGFRVGIPPLQPHIARPRFGMLRIFDDCHTVNSQLRPERVDLHDQLLPPAGIETTDVGPFEPRFLLCVGLAVAEQIHVVLPRSGISVSRRFAASLNQRLRFRDQLRCERCK